MYRRFLEGAQEMVTEIVCWGREKGMGRGMGRRESFYCTCFNIGEMFFTIYMYYLFKKTII